MTPNPLPRNVDISARKLGHPRVLIVRLSAVGDCLQTMPLACAVRDRWPTPDSRSERVLNAVTNRERNRRPRRAGIDQ